MTTERVEIAVVGSGRAALNVLSRLPEKSLRRCVVIDPSGSWLHAFARTQLRTGTTHLRSTATQVPFDSACGLERYVEMTGKTREIYRKSDGFTGIPSVRVFAEYCAKTISERFGNTRLVRGAVVDARWCGADSEEVQAALKADDNNTELMCFGAMLLTLDTGKRILSARCVWTPKFSSPMVPSWVFDAKDSYAKAHAEYDGQGTECGIMCARDIDVSLENRVRDKCVLVIGGGMTAATLALSAHSRGAKAVTLMCRKKIVVSEFECDVKYFGSKGLREFHACDDAQLRSKRLESYKSRASVNEHTHRRLRETESNTEADEDCILRIMEQRVVIDATWNQKESKWRVRMKPTDEARVQFEATMHRMYRDEGIEPSAAALAEFEREVTSAHDEIWLACGEVVDLEKDSALQTLCQTTQVKIAGGFPLLDEEDFEDEHQQGVKAAAGGGGGCRWPGTSMYVLGAYASLTIGPGADLPVGHRLAAKQLVDAMKRHQMMILKKQNPYQRIADLSSAERTPERGESFNRFKRLPPELSDKGLIDIEDLLGGEKLELIELGQYEFYEEDLLADIRLKLPEPIQKSDVYVCFESRALEMWAFGKTRAYRFYIRKLYKEVMVDKCSYKVFPSKNRITLKIQKFSNHYWRYLKG
ncbi:HSP20-like chaperone [Ostreococcus tauri]|uniref:HSP20-like chaperone n=1 Tax=Ostreococcus tauri TaxID=70448 RepID=Q018X1_OSTTA|nr:HSP20-like chaperone [Ostreococcus tauri]CAL54054.1 HSP20-like chaperone [Ostreococcus tauri]|eukprot:XP_003079396.1 HSP20-like chaperone [Ostreococcus tauri]